MDCLMCSVEQEWNIFDMLNKLIQIDFILIASERDLHV